MRADKKCSRFIRVLGVLVREIKCLVLKNMLPLSTCCTALKQILILVGVGNVNVSHLNKAFLWTFLQNMFKSIREFSVLIDYHWNCLWLFSSNFKDTNREKHRQIELQRLHKVRIWTFGSLVHQINSLWEFLKLKQNFKKNELVSGKTQFFTIDLFCTHHSICLKIGFWYGSFVWKWCLFNLRAFN